MKSFIVASLLTLFAVPTLFAAEVKNDLVRQEGNRLVVTYDLEGTEQEAKVAVTIKAGGKTYGADQFHLEGDVGTVRPGKGKKIWWNVLQDFPRGLHSDIEVTVSAGGGEFRDPSTGMEFVWVPGGCFQMGCGSWQRDKCAYDEEPLHEVCVDGFWMGKTEVTQGQWKKIMDDNPSYNTSLFKNTDNYPVEKVNWNDIQEFIRKLKQQTGKKYALPTEAEWEYAARSGGKDEKYAGSGSIDAVGWSYGNSDTHPVAQKRANGLGLYDMSGNVWELCQDWYAKDYYSNSPRHNPEGPSSGPALVERGGGYSSGACTTTNRGYHGGAFYRSSYELGFRLVLRANQ
ncbi:MAG: formylglycine-generating enzyme family protein [Geobacteraceae bacterium]|nr:formylglycine-generating enzyme family protein [Geobacteraceae bacterium]